MNLNIFRTAPETFFLKDIGPVQIKHDEIRVRGARPTLYELLKIHDYLEAREARVAGEVKTCDSR